MLLIFTCFIAQERMHRSWSCGSWCRCGGVQRAINLVGRIAALVQGVPPKTILASSQTVKGTKTKLSLPSIMMIQTHLTKISKENALISSTWYLGSPRSHIKYWEQLSLQGNSPSGTGQSNALSSQQLLVGPGLFFVLSYSHVRFFFLDKQIDKKVKMQKNCKKKIVLQCREK